MKPYKVSENGNIRSILTNPHTNKKQRRVFVTGKGWYGWNTAYHVYNSVADYSQLSKKDVEKIEWGIDLNSPAWDWAESNMTPEQEA